MALLKAQEMLVRHGLTMDDISFGTPAEVLDVAITPYQRTIWWKKSLAKILADNFRCYCYVNRRYGGSCIQFIVFRDDVELAKTAFEFGCEAIQYNANKYMQSLNRSSQPGVRNSYILGFLEGLTDKFNEQKAENQEWGLVLVYNQKVTDKYNELHLRRGNTTRLITGSDKAKAEGYKKGHAYSPAAGRLRGGI